MLWIMWVGLGVVSAIGFNLIAQKTRSPNRVLAVGLVTAALIYLGFAVIGRAAGTWWLIEFAGLGVYGLCAGLGLWVSPWWLMLGWLLHPVWDVWLHWLNAGAAFTPEWYVWVCLGFDLMVAADIAMRQLSICDAAVVDH